MEVLKLRNGNDIKYQGSEFSELEQDVNLPDIVEKLQLIVGQVQKFNDRAPAAGRSARALLELSQRHLCHRRSVDQVFSKEGFATSPAWDIILDLYLATYQEKKLSITSVCIGAGCPPTTALRWIKVLEADGLIERRPDPSDHRRMWVLLTPQAIEKAENALNSF